MSKTADEYKVCPNCGGMYDAKDYDACLTCKMPLRPATEKEVLDFFRDLYT